MKDVSIAKYEKRTDKFNVHARWEWEAKFKKDGIVLGDVIIYEIPTIAHDACVRAIGNEIMAQCRNVKRTVAKIYSLGTTRRLQFIKFLILCLCFQTNLNFLKVLVLEIFSESPMIHLDH